MARPAGTRPKGHPCNKVEELVLEPGKPQVRTDYIGNAIYKTDSLQYALNDEGRSVYIADSNIFRDEFFVRDHLGDVRSVVEVINVVTQQYMASYEVASANLEGLLFDNLTEISEEMKICITGFF